MAGLEKARAIGPAATIETVLASGLRGRGGAGFPTGIKWKTTAEAPPGANVRTASSPAQPQKDVGPRAKHGKTRVPASCPVLPVPPVLWVSSPALPMSSPAKAGDPRLRRHSHSKWCILAPHPAYKKYIVCNADEGDSGTYADRMLMEGDPFCLIEGMAIAGLAVGARKGYVYTRSEYPHAIATFDQALAIARATGADVLGSAAFDIEQRVGAGAYVCGEETSLLESLEGRRGAGARQAAAAGASRACSASRRWSTTWSRWPPCRSILRDGRRGLSGDSAWAARAARCRSSWPAISSYGGLFEAGFGVTLGEIVNDIGGGTRSGRPVRAVQVGGPLGAYFPPVAVRHAVRLRGVRGAKTA